MEILTQQYGYRIEFNGKSTYLICDDYETYYRVDTLRKAKNKLKKVLSNQNLEFTNF